MSLLCSIWALTYSRSRINILNSPGVKSSGSHDTSSYARTEQEHHAEDVSFPYAFLWYLPPISCRRASNLLSCLGCYFLHESSFPKLRSRKKYYPTILLLDSTKHDTAVITVFFTELFEVKCKRGSRNNFFAESSWESPVVRNSWGRSEGKNGLPDFPTFRLCYTICSNRPNKLFLREYSGSKGDSPMYEDAPRKLQ